MGCGGSTPAEVQHAQPSPEGNAPGFGFFLLRDADFKGRDDRSSWVRFHLCALPAPSSPCAACSLALHAHHAICATVPQEPCADLNVAISLLAHKPKRHDMCYALRGNQLVTIPAVGAGEMGNGAKWSHGAELIVYAQDTGHRSQGKALIALKDVDCCFGDGGITNGVHSYAAALATIIARDNVNQTAYFLHSPSNRLIEKPKDRGSNWVGYGGYGWLFLWADGCLSGGGETGGGGQVAAAADLGLGSTSSHGNPPSTSALNTELNNVARNTNDTAKARALVAAGADLSSTNGPSWRHTPLHQACYHGRYEMATVLIELGARLDLHSNPCGRGKHGTPIELARGGGHTRIIKLLEQAGKEGEGKGEGKGKAAASMAPTGRGRWEQYRDIDMCGQGDVEILPDWKRHYSVDDLKRMVEERGYSAFTVSAGHPSFGHAALKKFPFALTKAHCKPISTCCRHPCTIYIYTAPEDDPPAGEDPAPPPEGGEGGFFPMIKSLLNSALAPLSPSAVREYRFSKVDDDAFDTGGILFAIGTGFGKHAYANPAESGKVAVQWSHDCSNFYSTQGGHKVGDARQAASVICAHRHPGHNATQWSMGASDAWFVVDLRGMPIVPTHFAYRNDYGGGGNHPRTFELQGSNDGTRWTPLSKHSNEQWSGKGAKHWPITGCEEHFTKFRILNQGAPNHLCCAGIELYGRVVSGDGEPPAAGSAMPVVMGVAVESKAEGHSTTKEEVSTAPHSPKGRVAGVAPRPLVESVTILKRELGLDGTLNQVVHAAAEQLGVTTEGKSLVDLTAECIALLEGAEDV